MVSGRFVRDEEGAAPLAHARVELFLEDRGRERFLGRARTARDGRFHAYVDLPATAVQHHVVAKMIELRPAITPGEPIERRWRVVARARSAPLEELQVVALETTPVEHWLLRPGAATTLRQRAPSPELDEVWPAEEAMAANERARRLTAALVRQPWLGADEPRLAVARALEASPDASVSLERLCAEGPRLGWSALPTGRWRWTGPALPGWAVPAWVEVDGRAVRAVGWRGQGEERVSREGEAGWDEAQAVVASSMRCAWVVEWMTCHLLLEGWALAARRQLAGSPLRALLEPHLRDVCSLNRWAEERIAAPVTPIARCLPGGPPALALALRHDLSRAALLGAAGGPRWAGELRGEVRALVSAAVERAVARYLVRYADELAEHWTEVRALAAEIAAFDALAIGALSGERRPTEHDVGVLRAWLTRVLVVGSIELSWTRDRALSALQHPDATLACAWGAGGPAPVVEPESYAHRLFLLRLVWSGRAPSLVEDRLGEVEPLLKTEIMELAGPLAAMGWSVDKLGYRASV